jgi:hypothetical protein
MIEDIVTSLITAFSSKTRFLTDVPFSSFHCYKNNTIPCNNRCHALNRCIANKTIFQGSNLLFCKVQFNQRSALPQKACNSDLLQKT